MNGNLTGKRVECVSAWDHAQVVDGGTVYAYSNKPVYMIRRDDGSKFTWNEDIVREATELTVEIPVRLVERLRTTFDSGMPSATGEAVLAIIEYVRSWS